MCSRYFLDADGNVIAYTFHVPVHDRIRKRFNIAPTQEAPVIRAAKAGAREVAMLRWGLVPFWAKDLEDRHEDDQRAQRDAWRRSPRSAMPSGSAAAWCPPPASSNGQGEPGQQASRTPSRSPTAALRLRRAVGVAGSRPRASSVETFTILTTDANRAMSRDPRSHAGDPRRCRQRRVAHGAARGRAGAAQALSPTTRSASAP